MSSAVVFAYHNVGCRCLAVLLARGIEVRLVVTHRDDPAENLWFDRVADLAEVHRLPLLAPDSPADPALLARVRAAAPDLLFSFYYRHILGEALLAVPRLGAFNMHGSLLPRYRGRAPVNWAVIRGERETGASLHHMAAKPDSGDLVDQQAVPILPDDTARQVFDKVTVAAEMVLHRQAPALATGTAPRRPLDLTSGSYFGGRKPEDGCIHWSRPAREVHNLVRGVAPPYPGAFTTLDGQPARVLRTLPASLPTAEPPGTFYREGDRLLAACGDGRALPVLDLEIAGRRLSTADFPGGRLCAAA